MNNEKIKKGVLNCLNNIGIIVDEYKDTDIISFSDLIHDSLTFVSFVVELEQYFKIEIPDSYLLIDNFKVLNDVYKMIANLT